MKKKAPPPGVVSVVGYIRISRMEEGLGEEDIQKVSQDRRRELFSYAAAHALPEPVIYEDLDRTGTNTKRPGFLQMIAAVEKGQVSHVLTRDWSRLFRNTLDMLLTEDRLAATGVQVISLLEPYLSQDSADARMMKTIKAAVNQHQAEFTGMKVKAHRKGLAEAGLFTGGKCPLGLTWNSDQRRFVAVPAEVPAAVRLFTVFAETESGTQTAKVLNRERVLTGNGKLWMNSRILRHLRNPLYRGYQVFDGELYPVEADRIIPDPVLAAVDSILSRWEYSATPKAKYGMSGPFVGMLRCGWCGYAMRRVPVTNQRGRSDVYYLCSSRTQRGVCTQPGLRENRIEAALPAVILSWLTRHRQEIQSSLPPCLPPPPSPNRTQQIRHLRQARQRLIAWMIQHEEESSAWEDAQKELLPLNQEIKRLESEQSQAPPPSLSPALLERLMEAWQSFPELEVPAQRALCSELRLRLIADSPLVQVEVFGERLSPLFLPPLRRPLLIVPPEESTGTSHNQNAVQE